jgi:hypothetical protein
MGEDAPGQDRFEATADGFNFGEFRHWQILDGTKSAIACSRAPRYLDGR